MKAKEYLSQIRNMKDALDRCYDHIEELCHEASGVKAIVYDRDRVQVSPSNKLEELVEVPETGSDGEKKTEVELLIERIREIQKQIPAHSEREDEREFERAAEEFYEAWHSRRRRGMWR